MPDLVPLSAFTPDAAWRPEEAQSDGIRTTAIDGLTVEPLIQRRDDRGFLTELLTLREGDHDPIVHVYQVHAEPGSVRAWVFHRWQDDRLAYTEGTFRLVCYDLREGSPSLGKLVVLDVGAENPCRVTIPPLVAHGLSNIGTTRSSFVNMPTTAYDPARPDKARLPYPDPRIPFTF